VKNGNKYTVIWRFVLYFIKFFYKFSGNKNFWKDFNKFPELTTLDILCQNHFCWTAKFCEEIVNHSRAVASEDFQYVGSVLEL